MGCISASQKNVLLQNEISLTPIPDSMDKIPLDSDANPNAKNEKLNSLNKNNITKYRIHLKRGDVEISLNQINKLSAIIKDYLFRKKYNQFLKNHLLDYTSDKDFEFIILTKNFKSSKVINSKNETIQKFLKLTYHKFYKNDPSQIIKNNLSKIKKYQNGLIFTYKENNTIQSCYKGSVDVLTNKKNGNGELICIDGSQYIGLFYNNEFNGWNIYISPLGEIFVGFFINNYLNGKGYYYNPDNECIYKGDFKLSKREGFGEEYFSGYKYIGQFMNDKKCGNGEMTLKNNDIYKGSFLDDKFNGKGKYIWNNIKKEYDGNFQNGKIHGNGYLIWNNYMYYKGEFNCGVKEGKGEFGFINGNKFFFNFKMGLPYGKGYMEDQNNNINEVNFNQGKIFDNNGNEYLFSFQ